MRVWIYLLRKGAYRDFLHIILKHTISNKLVSKVSAQKKGGKSYDSYKCVQISEVNGIVHPSTGMKDKYNHGKVKYHHDKDKYHKDKYHHGKVKYHHGKVKYHHGKVKYHHGKDKYHHGKDKYHHGKDKYHHGKVARTVP